MPHAPLSSASTADAQAGFKPGAASPSVRNLLFICPRKIGDVLLATPLVRAVQEGLPEARIQFLAAPPCDQALWHNPRLHAILRYPTDRRPGSYWRLLRQIRNERFDAVVDLFASRVSARLTYWSGARLRIGMDRRRHRWAYTHPVPELPRDSTYHVSARAILLQPLGLALDGLRAEIYVSAAEREAMRRELSGLGIAPSEPLIALVPGSRERSKVWPAQRFAVVADALLTRTLATHGGGRVLLLSAPDERGQAASVRALMAHAPRSVLLETPTLRECFAALERCALFVGNDTAMRHAAIALDVPTVGVFGHAFPEVWTPPDEPPHRSLAFDPGCKVQCAGPRCTHLSCIRGIPTQDVLTESLRALDEALLQFRIAP